MLQWFKADLHVHTCLSPCGDLKMSPRNIMAKVFENKMDIIAITDHNSADNVRAVMKSAQDKKVVVLPGMEVCTNEEVHILAIFETLASADEMQSLVYDHLKGENDPDVFGMQIIANEFDEVEGFQNKLLIGATDLTAEQVVNAIHRLNGLAIASHIDRESFSIIGQLGFIPESLRFDALEISSNTSDEEAEKRFCEYKHSTFIRNSDAHKADDIGKGISEYLLEDASFRELKKALWNEDGRMARTKHEDRN